jgi:hypothetical protein
MDIRAAVFHRAHDPVPIEAIGVDKPSGRKVLEQGTHRPLVDPT